MFGVYHASKLQLRPDASDRLLALKYVPVPAEEGQQQMKAPQRNSADADGGSPTLDQQATAPAEQPTQAWQTGDQAAVSPPERPSGRLGDYVLLKELARGGMGVVYLARQQKLDRIVALKMILSGELAGREAIERFHAEAEAAANLDHPGIVPIYEVGEHEGQHFYAMAYVEGCSLADRIANGPLPPREAAQIVAQVARAVQFAHQQGVIHRDLKPANILLPRGLDPASRNSLQPKITDFGVAKRTTSDSHLTASGQILGTPSYMPPEQASGHADQVGASADVYAIGAVLYAALTGRPPFQAASVWDTIRQVLERDPVPPRQLNTALDRDLETVCLKCLEKRPERRYDSAGRVAEDLERWLNHEPIMARRTGPLGRTLRWCRRKPLLAGTLALTFLSLLVGSAVSTYFAVRTARYANLLEERLYIHRVNRSYREWQANDVTLAETLLTACSPSLRGWEWQFCNGLLHQELAVLRKHRDLQSDGESYMCGVLDLALNANGTQAASAGADGHVYVWNPGTGETLFELPPQTGAVHSVAFSPDGSLIATGGEDGILRLHDAQSGSLLRELADHQEWILALDFSPDGESIATIGGGWGAAFPPADYALRTWNVATGKVQHRLSGHTSTPRALDFSPDGIHVATGGLDGRLHIWNVQEPALARVIDVPDPVLHAVCFTPDGAFCAAGGFDGAVRLWDHASGTLAAVLHGHDSFVRSIAFAADGRRMLTSSEDNTIKLWDVHQAKVTRTLRGHRQFTNAAIFDPERNRILSASDDATVRAWTEADPSTLVLGQHGGWVDGLAFDPTGRRLYSASRVETEERAELFCWDVRTGLRQWTSRADSNAVMGLAVSGDGGQLATYGWDDTIRVFDASTSELTAKFRSQQARVHQLLYQPATQRLASAGEDGTVKLWDVQHRQLLWQLEHPAVVRAMAFAADGRRLVTLAQDDFLRIWNVHGNPRVQWSSQAPSMYQGHGHVAFSPDGAQVAAACRDGSVRVWASSTGEPLWVLRGHTGPVYQVCYSPDGRRLVSGSRDKSIKLWDPRTGIEVFTLRGHSGTVLSVTFSPDGKHIASGGVDNAVRLWSIDAERTPHAITALSPP